MQVDIPIMRCDSVNIYGTFFVKKKCKVILICTPSPPNNKILCPSRAYIYWKKVIGRIWKQLNNHKKISNYISQWKLKYINREIFINLKIMTVTFNSTKNFEITKRIKELQLWNYNYRITITELQKDELLPLLT